MFSATFPEEIQKLAGKFLHDYVFVAVGIVGGACTDVEQIFYEVDKFKKRNKLVEILKEGNINVSIVIFVFIHIFLQLEAIEPWFLLRLKEMLTSWPHT